LRELEAAGDPMVLHTARALAARKRLAEANSLLLDQKLAEAAAVFREVARLTADPVAKAELEERAASLDATVAAARKP